MEGNPAGLATMIQIVVAPVFLLAGIAGFLNVMSARMGRIVDRARVLEERMQVQGAAYPRQPETRKELRSLWRRVKISNLAIAFCTASALMACVLVVALFTGGMWLLDVKYLVVGFFVLSLSFLIVALLLFLKEVQIATRMLKGSSDT